MMSMEAYWEKVKKIGCLNKFGKVLNINADMNYVPLDWSTSPFVDEKIAEILKLYMRPKAGTKKFRSIIRKAKQKMQN